MTDEATRVHDARSFRQALAAGTRRLEIAAAITDLEPVDLPAGTQLHGTVEQAGLAFKAGGAGLRLIADHEISALRLATDPDQIALGLTDTAQDLGTLALSRLHLEGRLHLEAERLDGRPALEALWTPRRARDIRTKGSEGPSLVRGKVVSLKAHALSLKPGVKGDAILVLGQVVAERTGIAPYEFVAPARSVDLILVDGVVVH